MWELLETIVAAYAGANGLLLLIALDLGINADKPVGPKRREGENGARRFLIWIGKIAFAPLYLLARILTLLVPALPAIADHLWQYFTTKKEDTDP